MIKSYSKINLSLRVLKKLKTGMHDIQSNSVLVDLHDKIYVTNSKKKKDIIIFKGEFKHLVSKSNNSVLKTLSILREKKLIKKSQKLKIVIEKKIPVFSGLGGGTSNAFFITKHFLKSKLDENIIKELEKKVGSDIRLFTNKQVFQKKLKKVIKFEKNFEFHVLLVYPYIKCSTKKIYDDVKDFSRDLKINFHKTQRKTNYIRLLKKEKNDLEKISIKKYRVIKLLLDNLLLLKNCHFSRMTGSGSACYGIFVNQKSVKLGYKTIKKKFPNYWCVVTKTI